MLLSRDRGFELRRRKRNTKTKMMTKIIKTTIATRTAWPFAGFLSTLIVREMIGLMKIVIRVRKGNDNTVLEKVRRTIHRDCTAKTVMHVTVSMTLSASNISSNLLTGLLSY
jgi:hypothetical protein